MRKLGFGVGALLTGVALTFAVAAPAAAQETASAQSPDSDQVAVADSTQSYVATVVEVSAQEAFQEAFEACVALTGDIDACTDEVLETLGLEEEEVFLVDETPLNPNDVAAIEVVEDVPLDVNPPLPAAEE